jgi:hypothetical protein
MRLSEFAAASRAPEAVERRVLVAMDGRTDAG